MQIILAAATTSEINSTLEWLKTQSINAEAVITGIGGAMTAWSLTKAIHTRRPDLVIQAGIGGSFTGSLVPGSIVFVSEEIFADLGAIDGQELTDIFDLGLAGINDAPFTNRKLVNPDIASWKEYGLPFVKGATINCVSSNPQQVSRIKEKYDPEVESMEGAALHYVCLQENIPFIQLRSISNYTGERDKKKWKMKEAIQVLNEQLKKILEGL